MAMESEAEKGADARADQPAEPAPSRWRRLLGWLPGVDLFSSYSRACLAPDVTAGLVVALVVIPSAIAYADLAKCPPATGLYAALGGMVVFALFTSSRHVICGPDAAVAILVGAAIGPIAYAVPGQALAEQQATAIALSTWLALLTGFILLLAAWLKLGAVAEFLSSPVMLGFMNGAAVVIIGSQIGKLCGISLHQENTLQRFFEWATKLDETHGIALGFGLGAIAILAGFKLWLPRIPGTIVVFGLALIAGRFIDFEGEAMRMAVIGAVDTSIPTPAPPEMSLAEVGQLVTAALGLSLLIFPEGILLGRAMADTHNYDIKPDRELVALGAANLAAGIFRSYAVGGSQSRTMLNSATGGRTQMVSLIAASLLVVFMFFLASWIATLPTVAIAAILTFTGVTLIDFRAYRKLRQQHAHSARIALITSIGVVAFGVLPGILLGIVLSLLNLLTQVVRPQDALLGRAPGTNALHDLGDDESAETIPGLVAYRFYGPLVFANVRFFIERLEHFIAREKAAVRQVIIDARAIPAVDVTAAEQLHAYFQRLRERGIAVVLAKAHLPLRQAAQRLGMHGALSEETYYPRLSDAVAAFERRFSSHLAGHTEPPGHA